MRSRRRDVHAWGPLDLCWLQSRRSRSVPSVGCASFAGAPENERRGLHTEEPMVCTTLRWREMDSNFQYASIVRWHRATDLLLPPTVKRRSAGRPPPMARPRSEAQRGSVTPAAAMRSTHREMRCSAAVQAVRYRTARRAAMRSAHLRNPAGRAVATAPSPTAKSLPLAHRLLGREIVIVLLPTAGISQKIAGYS